MRETITETVEQAIDSGDISVPERGTGILSVGQANVDGTSGDFAAVDHVHKGNHFSATDAASLPSETDGSDGVTTGSNKRLYGRVNSAWLCLSHLE